MGDDFVTHGELARLVGVSETTIKNYRAKYPSYFPLLRRGKPLRFDPVVRDVVSCIRRAVQGGHGEQEVRDLLAERFPEMAAHRPVGASADKPGTPPAQSSGLGDPGSDKVLVQFFQAMNNLRADVKRLAQAQETAGKRFEDLARQVAALQEDMASGLSSGAGVDSGGDNRGQNSERPTDEGIPAHGTPGPSLRHVRVRNAFGDVHDYLLETRAQGEQEDGDPDGGPATSPDAPQEDRAGVAQAGAQAPGAGPDTRPVPLHDHGPDAAWPPEAFLALPLAIRTVDGAYIAVARRPEGHFGVRHLLELMEVDRPGVEVDGYSDAPRILWTSAPGSTAWQASMHGALPGGFGSLDIRFEPVITPRGNEIAVVADLRVDGVSRPDKELREVVRAAIESE